MKNLYIINPKEKKLFLRQYKGVSEHLRPLVWSGDEWDMVKGSRIKNVYVFWKPPGFEEFINQIAKPCMIGNGGSIIMVERK